MSGEYRLTVSIRSHRQSPLLHFVKTWIYIEAENFKSVVGKGVSADCVVCHDAHHCVGKLPFITEEHEVQNEIVAIVDELQQAGKTSVVASTDNHIEGIIALSDEIKDESRGVIDELKSLGVEPVILTGDNRGPASKVARRTRNREGLC